MSVPSFRPDPPRLRPVDEPLFAPDQPVFRPGDAGWPAGAARAALQSRVRPSLVLDERVARALIAEATHFDVSKGGRYSAGPAGVQVWSGPWNGVNGTHGTALHLGSVDWTYNTPARDYVTIYRSMVTQHGLDRGETTESILVAVLSLVGQTVDGPRIEQPMPPSRDPFKAF